MTEYEIEPVPGLPGNLPAGERILWQGAPAWRALAHTAFHTRAVAGYFIILATVALSRGTLTGFAMTLVLGAAAVGLLHLLAWASARSTIYTLTNRRIVMRIGIAVPKCINLPLTQIGAADLAARADGTGDVPLTLLGTPKLGYLALWPHARSLKLSRPQPMLRAVPDAVGVAAMVARACLSANPAGQITAPERQHTDAPAFAEAQAA